MRRLSDRAGGVAPILFKRLRSLIQEGTPFELPRQPLFAASAGRNAVTEPDDKKEELLATEDDLLSRDPEVANRALERISQIFEDQEDRGKVSGNDPEEPDAAALDLTAETELTDVLSDLHPADIAYILEALPPEQRLAVWNLVRHEHEGDVLVEVSEGVRETLIDSMDREELVDAVEGLDTDEIADLVDDLPPDVVAEVQEGLSHEERAQLRAAMSYPEDSVGARMDFEMISIRQDVSLEIVLKFLRRFESLPDHTDQLFVVDRQGKFLGALPVAQILVHEPTRSVSSLMQSDILTLNPLDDASDAAQAFERYDLVSSPVVDEAGRLVGRLTVNEVVDVIREESAEDAYAAVGLDEEQDIFGSVWDSAKSRWVWLGVNLCTAFFASRVISAFDGTISKVVALAALMPVVAGMAGNSGNQTLTLLVRSMAMGQVTDANTGRLLRKELLVALLNGLVWGVIAGLCVWGLYHDSAQGMMLGGVMALAMLLNIVLGAAMGLAVPLVLKALNKDPAMGGSVLLTFMTDSGGFLIFLGLASVFFR
ncbi:MAG TPA: magnesium transporter [Candidatus Duodenibacillus intestinigallinarum]|nr:magnesium transporter [Candidatus Duodenibacillus intestinigallinarum]